MLGRLRKHACTSRGLRAAMLRKHAVVTPPPANKPGMMGRMGRMAGRLGAKGLANPGVTLTLGSTALGAAGRAGQVWSSMNPSVMRQNLGM